MQHSPYQSIDPQVLLKAVGGDLDAFRSMTETYLRIAPPMLARLQQAAAAGDGAAVTRESHALKGTTALVGAARLTQQLAQIESLARSAALELLPTLLPALEPEFRHVMQEVAASIADVQDGAPQHEQERRR